MASKDTIVAELRQVVAQQAEQIAALTKRIAELELRRAKAQKDSSRSSKSPSSDITNAGKGNKNKKLRRPKKRKLDGRQRGIRPKPHRVTPP